MPNRSGNSAGVRPPSFYSQWQNTDWSELWSTSRQEQQAETLVQSAEDQEALDESYALIEDEVVPAPRVSPENTFEPQAYAAPSTTPFQAADPADYMAEHVADNHAIRHYRRQLNNTELTPRQRGDIVAILQSLVHISRTQWNSNGGRTNDEVRRAARQEEVATRPRRSLADSLGLSGSVGQRVEAPVRRRGNDGQTFFGNIPETSTMTTVASQWGMRVNYPSIEKHPLIVGTHLAGIEIELENITAETPSFRYWTAKGDGSLRNNGMEFVCSHPWGGTDLYNAAVEIDGFLFGNNPDTTWRCSTHVHIDVRDMTAAQVKKMILAYVFYERLLFKCSGWHRYKNNFCAALGFAQGQLEDLGNWWAENDSTFLSNLASRWDKYTAINFLPMGSFGSIEFRISEAKWHKGQLIRLANRFLSLKEVAIANTDLSEEDFLAFLASSDPKDIIRKGIPKGLTNFQDDLEVGFKLAHDILSLAKLRRRNRRMLRPDLTDGSRVVLQPRGDMFINGWNHTVSHLRMQYPDIDLPDIREMRSEDGNFYQFNFKFLWELKKMMEVFSYTWEVDWFLPSQNRTQLKRLFTTYCAEQAENGTLPPQPQNPPRSRRREAQPEPWEEDADTEDDVDSAQW